MGLINKAFKFVFDKNYRFLALDQRGVYNSMDDKEYLERKYESIFNIKLDLENPETFNQKIQWLKLYFRRPEFTQYVDKYAVREYIANKPANKITVNEGEIYSAFKILGTSKDEI